MDVKEEPSDIINDAFDINKLRRMNDKISHLADETKDKAQSAFTSPTAFVSTKFKRPSVSPRNDEKTIKTDMYCKVGNVEDEGEDDNREDLMHKIAQTTAINLRSRSSTPNARTAPSPLRGRKNDQLGVRVPRSRSNSRAASKTRPLPGDRAGSRPTTPSQPMSPQTLRPSSTMNSIGSVPILSFGSEYGSDVDLRHNDVAFQVVANMIEERFAPKVVDGSTSFTIDNEDMSYLDEVLPESVRKSFVDALRFRTQFLPTNVNEQEQGLFYVTRECARLGFGRPDEKNVLLKGGQKISGDRILVSNVPKPPVSSNGKGDDIGSRNPIQIRTDLSVRQDARREERSVLERQSVAGRSRASVGTSYTRKQRLFKPLVTGRSTPTGNASVAQSITSRMSLTPRQRRALAEKDQEEKANMLRSKEQEIADQMSQLQEAQKLMAQSQIEQQKLQMKMQQEQMKAQQEQLMELTRLQTMAMTLQDTEPIASVTSNSTPVLNPVPGSADMSPYENSSSSEHDKLPLPQGMSWLGKMGLSPQQMTETLNALGSPTQIPGKQMDESTLDIEDESSHESEPSLFTSTLKNNEEKMQTSNLSANRSVGDIASTNEGKRAHDNPSPVSINTKDVASDGVCADGGRECIDATLDLHQKASTTALKWISGTGAFLREATETMGQSMLETINKIEINDQGTKPETQDCSEDQKLEISKNRSHTLDTTSGSRTTNKVDGYEQDPKKETHYSGDQKLEINNDSHPLNIASGSSGLISPAKLSRPTRSASPTISSRSNSPSPTCGGSASERMRSVSPNPETLRRPSAGSTRSASPNPESVSIAGRRSISRSVRSTSPTPETLSFGGRRSVSGSVRSASPTPETTISISRRRFSRSASPTPENCSLSGRSSTSSRLVRSSSPTPGMPPGGRNSSSRSLSSNRRRPEASDNVSVRSDGSDIVGLFRNDSGSIASKDKNNLNKPFCLDPASIALESARASFDGGSCDGISILSKNTHTTAGTDSITRLRVLQSASASLSSRPPLAPSNPPLSEFSKGSMPNTSDVSPRNSGSLPGASDASRNVISTDDALDDDESHVSNQKAKTAPPTAFYEEGSTAPGTPSVVEHAGAQDDESECQNSNNQESIENAKQEVPDFHDDVSDSNNHAKSDFSVHGSGSPTRKPAVNVIKYVPSRDSSVSEKGDSTSQTANRAVGSAAPGTSCSVPPVDVQDDSPKCEVSESQESTKDTNQKVPDLHEDVSDSKHYLGTIKHAPSRELPPPSPNMSDSDTLHSSRSAMRTNHASDANRDISLDGVSSHARTPTINVIKYVPSRDSTVSDKGGLDSPSSTESGDIAVSQKLTLDLKESKALLETSVTPEARDFWEAHIRKLQSRLDVLAENTVQPVDSESNSTHVQQMQSAHHAQETQSVGSEGLGKKGTEDSSVRKGSECSLGGKRSESSVNYRGSSVDENNENIGLMGSFADVVAPSDLPEGYTFEARMGSKRFMATVPVGGVKEGHTFQCLMKELENHPVLIEVPEFAWRDDLLDILKHGFEHPFLILSILFPYVAIGQVMTRLKLNWLGKPASSAKEKKAVRSNMLSLTAFWIAMNGLVVTSVYVNFVRGVFTAFDFHLFIAVNVVMIVFSAFVTCNTRRYIREKYSIPEEYEQFGSDYLKSLFMMPFAISQMGRHTGDYNTLNSYFCTPTGLSDEVEISQPGQMESTYTPPSETSFGSHLV